MGGDPVNWIDPSGEFVWFAIGAAIGGIAGGVTAWASGGDAGDIFAATVMGAATGAISGGVGAMAAASNSLALAGAAIVADIFGTVMTVWLAFTPEEFAKIVKSPELIEKYNEELNEFCE